VEQVPTEAAEVAAAAVRKTRPFFAMPFFRLKTFLFTKTGSGQTEGKRSKRKVSVSQAIAGVTSGLASLDLHGNGIGDEGCAGRR
jgi:hypothetical protein